MSSMKKWLRISQTYCNYPGREVFHSLLTKLIKLLQLQVYLVNLTWNASRLGSRDSVVSVV